MAESGEGRWKDAKEAKAIYDKRLGAEGSFVWKGKPALIASLSGRPVVLDGSLDSFMSFTPVVFDGEQDAHATYGAVKAQDRLWATVRMARDKRFFNLACDVRQNR